jgi:hypothetical protein
MPKTIHPANSRWFWVFVLVSSLVFPTLELGAQTAQSPGLKVKVKVVEVTKTGTTISVNPVNVKLHKKQEIVVWVTNGLSMKIDFKPGNPPPGNPFTDLTCKGSFCGVLTPPSVEGIFKYKVTVDGVVLDPNVEVIK